MDDDWPGDPPSDFTLDITLITREDVLQRPSVAGWLDQYTMPDGSLDLACPCDDDECR